MIANNLGENNIKNNQQSSTNIKDPSSKYPNNNNKQHQNHNQKQ
jgi:hypothetical protein